MPTYAVGDERGVLVFEKVNNPNWTSTFFKATATSGSATISGTSPGLEVVPVSVATATKGGAPAAVRIFAMPPRVPAAARFWSSGGFSRFAAGISVPGAVGTATLTAAATGLASGTATFSIVP